RTPSGPVERQLPDSGRGWVRQGTTRFQEADPMPATFPSPAEVEKVSSGEPDNHHCAAERQETGMRDYDRAPGSIHSRAPALATRGPDHGSPQCPEFSSSNKHAPFRRGRNERLPRERRLPAFGGPTAGGS